jgi:hypothetical protein
MSFWKHWDTDRSASSASVTKSVGHRGSGANDGTRVDSAEWLAGFPFHVGDDVRVPDQPLHVEALRLRPDRVGQVEEVKSAFRLTTVVHLGGGNKTASVPEIPTHVGSFVTAS